jgi:hypothetical protein
LWHKQTDSQSYRINSEYIFSNWNCILEILVSNDRKCQLCKNDETRLQNRTVSWLCLIRKTTQLPLVSNILPYPCIMQFKLGHNYHSSSAIGESRQKLSRNVVPGFQSKLTPRCPFHCILNGKLLSGQNSCLLFTVEKECMKMRFLWKWVLLFKIFWPYFLCFSLLAWIKFPVFHEKFITSYFVQAHTHIYIYLPTFVYNGFGDTTMRVLSRWA